MVILTLVLITCFSMIVFVIAAKGNIVGTYRVYRLNELIAYRATLYTTVYHDKNFALADFSCKGIRWFYPRYTNGDMNDSYRFVMSYEARPGSYSCVCTWREINSNYKIEVVILLVVV